MRIYKHTDLIYMGQIRKWQTYHFLNNIIKNPGYMGKICKAIQNLETGLIFESAGFRNKKAFTLAICQSRG